MDMAWNIDWRKVNIGRKLRERAFVLVQKRLKSCGICELFEALSMFAKVKDSRRRSDDHMLQIEK